MEKWERKHIASIYSDSTKYCSFQHSAHAWAIVSFHLEVSADSMFSSSKAHYFQLQKRLLTVNIGSFYPRDLSGVEKKLTPEGLKMCFKDALNRGVNYKIDRRRIRV